MLCFWVKDPESHPLHRYIRNHTVMPLGIFFIKYRHELQGWSSGPWTRLTILSLSYLTHTHSMTSALHNSISLYSQPSHGISLLNDTIYTLLLMQCPALSLHLVNQIDDFYAYISHLLWSQSYQSICGSERCWCWEEVYIPTWSKAGQQNWWHSSSPSHPQLRHSGRNSQANISTYFPHTQRWLLIL